MVLRYYAEIKAGAPKSVARRAAATAFGITPATVRNALKAIDGLPENDWLSALVKDYKGRPKGEINPEIVRYFFSDYGRVEQPQAQAVYERTLAAAKHNGWGQAPSLKTLLRRFNDLPSLVRKQLREGDKAVSDALIHAERDRSGMKSPDNWNMDARRHDVMVRDGERIFRPTVTMLQDSASNFILGWEVAETESSASYRRVIVKAFSSFGVARSITFDNTRAAANKGLTAGAKNRFRFSESAEDIPGILPRVGCEVRFTLPYNGRSKLIERGFAELKERSEKHPRLAGAYCGRSPVHKPANYGECAVDIEAFRAVLAEAVEAYNTRIDRRSKVAFNKSHKETFEAGLQGVAVRKLTEIQRRYFFSIASKQTVSPSGEVFLGKRPYQNRFQSEKLREYAGKKIVIRFNPDDLNAPILAETIDERVIDEAVPLIEKRGFNNVDQAREHIRQKRAVARATKEAAKARNLMDALEMSAALPAPLSPSPPPDTPIIAPVFKQTPKPASSVDLEKDIAATLAGLEKVRRYGFGG
ncbi:transposase domain-containing protein [Methylocystis parvus]|uniref:transposase domain-containing protein n=1 Tax=Methylocystis parvus TaxID=134 RepID=UPI003C75D2DA